MPLKPETPPATGPDGGPRLYGVMDVLRLDRVAGWAIDRTDAAAALEIEIRREGRPVATVRADRLRKDLERGGLGTGRYGFTCTLEPPLEPGFEFTVTAVARSADGALLDLKRPGAATQSPDRERRMLERLYEEVTAIANRLAAPPPPAAPAPHEAAEAALADAVRRIELTQLRVEAALSAVAPPAPPEIKGLRVIAVTALALAAGSLALGLWSLLG